MFDNNIESLCRNLRISKKRNKSFDVVYINSVEFNMSQRMKVGTFYMLLTFSNYMLHVERLHAIFICQVVPFLHRQYECTVELVQSNI